MEGEGVPVETSVRMCALSGQQVYERFEKLPMESRKRLAEWARKSSNSGAPVLVLPKGVDGAEGRPEKWRLQAVDTQRWNQFVWKGVRWIAVNSKYDTPESLIASAMALLNDWCVALSFLANRYEAATEAVCVEVPVRFGLAMGFIRAQVKANEKELAGESPGQEEKEVRDAWVAEGLSMDDYRSFALQLFQIRQERDPPFVFMLFKGAPEKIAIVWFRDIHLSTDVFCKGLFLDKVENLYWPNFNHKADCDPPKEVCEREGCSNCGGLVSDAKLLSTFVRHKGPFRTNIEERVNTEMRNLWKERYQVKIDAALSEMTGKIPEDELKRQIEQMENDLKEKAEEERPSILKRVESETVHTFKRCMRCKLVKYCGGECQKKDWPLHQRYCVEKKA